MMMLLLSHWKVNRLLLVAAVVLRMRFLQINNKKGTICLQCLVNPQRNNSLCCYSRRAVRRSKNRSKKRTKENLKTKRKKKIVGLRKRKIIMCTSLDRRLISSKSWRNLLRSTRRTKHVSRNRIRREESNARTRESSTRRVVLASISSEKSEERLSQVISTSRKLVSRLKQWSRRVHCKQHWLVPACSQCTWESHRESPIQLNDWN